MAACACVPRAARPGKKADAILGWAPLRQPYTSPAPALLSRSHLVHPLAQSSAPREDVQGVQHQCLLQRLVLLIIIAAITSNGGRGRGHGRRRLRAWLRRTVALGAGFAAALAAIISCCRRDLEAGWRRSRLAGLVRVVGAHHEERVQ
jgi:hypothetical protein